ncbi:MAG: acetylglutamate kinase [Bacteroidota bacterium]
MKLTIVKIGGQLLNDQDRLRRLLDDFARLEGHKILVHGGGRRANELLQQLGIEPVMHQGRRITDAQTLEVVTMVYAGSLNKQLVADLQARACDAIGLCGADGNSILSCKRISKDIDYGYAGDIEAINTNLITKYLNLQLVPVFNAITHDKQGQLLNTNADTIASTLAVALSRDFKVRLLYCFEKPGVLVDPDDESSYLPRLSSTEYEAYKADGTIYDGMIPKLDNAFAALKAGAEVWIGREDLVSRLEGTRLFEGKHLTNNGPGGVFPQARKVYSAQHKGLPKIEGPLDLLKSLIATPSFSKQEDGTANILCQYLDDASIPFHRLGNNVWSKSKHFDPNLPTVLLNSHHDTVKPAKGYTRDPFEPTVEGDKLYGLGSNDAGASLVGMVAVFMHLYDKTNLPFNLIWAGTAEEEISGANGIAALLPELPKIDFTIVGEPTQMRMAIAERGLMVIDAIAYGQSGHAARNEGDNAIYKAMGDIRWIEQYRFDKESPLLGPPKMTVSQVQAGTQHNVVPDQCSFVIDVRSNEDYDNEALLKLLESKLQSELKPRSLRLQPSGIEINHPAVQCGLDMGLEYYGSPTLSDQALLGDIPSIKMGIGKSERSHTADEYVLISELEEGINTYIKFLSQLKLKNHTP